MKMTLKWSLLFKYIEYFDSRPKAEWAGGEKAESGGITMPYPVYSEKTNSFIRALENTGITDIDYLHILMENGLDTHEKFSELIDSADEQLLCAMLTFYVRQEHFADGLKRFKKVRERGSLHFQNIRCSFCK
ncbi:MAG: DUF6508 domain-containing protein [Planctomycetaceae bacterium]|nr:DUF6508 domain-containing protein [Planctomycetaceae bacterium]